MVEGRLRKFYEEVVLLKQAFVLNPDLTVEKALKDAEKDIGAPAKITGFVRFALGEGIEKEDDRLRGRSRGGGEEVRLRLANRNRARAGRPKWVRAADGRLVACRLEAVQALD